MQNTFIVRLEGAELDEAIERYGVKNVGYEAGKAFKAHLKRLRRIEAAKEAAREERKHGIHE